MACPPIWLIQAFDQTIQAELNSKQQTEYQLSHATIDFAKGKTREAKVQLQAILRTDPLNGQALILLGNHEKNSGNLAEAELHFERASHLPDFQIEAWESLGKLAVQRRDFKQAITYFKRAYSLSQASYLQEYIQKLISDRNVSQ